MLTKQLRELERQADVIQTNQFQQLQKMCKETIGNHIGGKPAYRLSYIPENQLGPEYWDFHELNIKGKEMFGFSSPNFNDFRKDLISYLNDLKK
jgi:hypothetical protein